MSQALHWVDTATVRFSIDPEGLEGPRCVAAIAEDPLRDLFGARGGGDSLVHACLLNADVINARALARYREAPSRQIMLENADFALSESSAEF